jgi:hypothetical protein
MKTLMLGLFLMSAPAMADFGNLVSQQVFYNGGQRMLVCTYQGLSGGQWQETYMNYNACPPQSSH